MNMEPSLKMKSVGMALWQGLINPLVRNIGVMRQSSLLNLLLYGTIALVSM